VVTIWYRFGGIINLTCVEKVWKKDTMCVEEECDVVLRILSVVIVCVHAEYDKVRTLENRPNQGQKPRSDGTINYFILLEITV